MNPRRPDLRDIRRVLIVKLSSIGDVVHALPVSAALGDAFPHLELTWIVEERAAPLVLGNPYLRETMVLPGNWHLRPWSWATWQRWRSLYRALQDRRFDLALDLQGLARSALIAWHSGARWCLGWNYLREVAPFLLTRVPRARHSVHVVEQLLDVARYLGAPAENVRFPLALAPADDAAAVALLRERGLAPDQPFVALNPTDGGYGHKGLGIARCVALIDALRADPGVPVALVGGVEDRVNVAAIERLVSPPPINLLGTTLQQLAAILRRASLHVTGDTGSAHLAAALQTPVVTVFGRTNPARLAPYGQAAHVVHHREQCAEPCRRRHARAPLNCDQICLTTPPRCLAAISAAELIAAVRRCWHSRVAGVPRP